MFNRSRNRRVRPTKCGINDVNGNSNKQGNFVVRKRRDGEILKECPPEKGQQAAGVNQNHRAAESLTRTKALLLAALRVWELKQSRDV